ncbi:MAG TPA: hypothetical protein DCW68_07225 [Rhodospirillaceae bacterium]|nr:MAG: hypothetical protein A2018_06730 [Alphaproteobacteria bacterium GWF2_58_20]HAU29877.1 hypothetical protein [Rhodospirillaceae bacterium]
MTARTRDEVLYAALQDIAPDTPGSFSEEVMDAAKALGFSGMTAQEALMVIMQVCLNREDDSFPGLMAAIPGGSLPTAHLRACGDDSIRVTENGTVRRTET